MGDRYLGFANSAIGRLIVSTLGLPRPPLLRRESDDSPHSLSGYVHVGISTGSLYATQIRQSLENTDLQWIGDNGQGNRHLIFDASGIRNTDQAEELYEFFHNNISKLPRCGRVVIIGHQP